MDRIGDLLALYHCVCGIKIFARWCKCVFFWNTDFFHKFYRGDLSVDLYQDVPEKRDLKESDKE